MRQLWKGATLEDLLGCEVRPCAVLNSAAMVSKAACLCVLLVLAVLRPSAAQLRESSPTGLDCEEAGDAVENALMSSSPFTQVASVVVEAVNECARLPPGNSCDGIAQSTAAVRTVVVYHGQ